jgi:hypothetical protein
MAIEKGIGAGGDNIIPMIPEEQIDIVEMAAQPGQVTMDDGSVIMGDISEEMMMQEVPIEIPFGDNLVEYIDEADAMSIASDLMGDIDDDMASRQDWEDTYKRGIDLLGMKYEERSQPFEGASGVVHPLLAESVTQFQAQAYRELLPAGGPVRTQIIGDETAEKLQQADRVKNYMNYQITYEMEEYDPELDQMLFYLPLIGSTFKKIYFDPLLQRAVSKFVHAEDLVVPYTATDLASATRITHIVKMDKNEIRKLQLSGFYADVDLPGDSYGEEDYSEIQESIDEAQGVAPSGTNEEITLYEVHTNLDIPGFEDMDATGEETGLKLPYIVTIIEKNNKVLSIRRNYEQSDPLRRAKPYFVHYKFLPGLGFYGFGLTHMIGGLSQAATSLLRQLIDAGTLSNLPAGFKARGARIRDEDEPLNPGEFRDIDVAGMDIRQSLMTLPFKEPSQTLYALLGTLVDSGRRFASMADMKVAEMGGETPVGTTMAIMERGTKVMSAIHKRLHYSQKMEFKLLANVFAKFMAPMYPYAIPGAPPEIKMTDFDDRIDVLPVSDPNIFSMSQRIALAQTELQLVQSNPEIHGNEQGLYQAYRKMYEALGVTNVDAILPPPPVPQPTNPAKENQEAMRGKPLQAFATQNHQAHIEAHLAIIATPVAQANATIVMTLQGHIQEHIGFMAEEMAQAEIINQLSPEEQMQLQASQEGMMAMQEEVASRAAEIVGELTEQYAQAVSPPQQQDPLVAIRQQELQLRGMDIERRAKEAADKAQLEREKEMNDQMEAAARINIQKEALDEKTRVAEERIQTQRDIAALNNMTKGKK